MPTFLWYFITVLAIDAVQVSGSHQLPNEASVGDSELTQAFRSIFQKALEPIGSYHRYLLISTGIVPPPGNYVTPRDERSGQLGEMPLTSELLEHFKKYTSEILTSREKLSLVIDRLFGDRTAWPNQEIRSFSRKRPALPTSTADFETTTEELEGQATSDSSCSSDFAADCTGVINTATVDPDIDSTVGISSTVEEFEHTSLSESSLESASATTSDYLKFLTDGLATLSSVEESKRVEASSADQISPSIPPVTQDYISFLRSESTQYPTESPSTEAAELEIGQSDLDSTDEPVEIETDLSETTRFLPILSTDYVKFLRSEYPLHLSTESSSAEATDLTEPVEELHIVDDSIDTESELTYINPETEFTTTAYSPYTGELLLTTVELGEEPSFSTAEVLEYWVESSPAAGSTESESRTTESSDISTKQPKSSTRKGRNNIVLGDTGGPLGQIFPNLPDIPDTNFTCDDKKHIPGFYADNETSCQVFHVCWPGRRESFLCPWGTTFNQAILACDYWDNSVCAETVAHYDVNAAFTETLSGVSQPLEENLLNMYQGSEKIKPKIITQDEYITELLEADVHFAETIHKHNLTTVWKKNLLPIKAKLYEKPHPDFSKYLFKHQSKSKRSKDDADATSTDAEDSESEESASKKLKIESIILNVLRKLSAENPDPIE